MQHDEELKSATPLLCCQADEREKSGVTISSDDRGEVTKTQTRETRQWDARQKAELQEPRVRM